jgi:hypothetical protein
VSDVTTIVETYLAMWNEEDAQKRATFIEQAWAPECRYVDPLLEADSYATLSDMVATVHGHYPGQRFTRTTGIDVHHDQVRFGWKLAGPDATTVEGVDICTLAEDGRLQRVTGFFGEIPAEEAAA